jgi:transcriptional regulator with XRE-family HTH domain
MESMMTKIGPMMTKIGPETLKELRKLRGLSQEALAEKSRVSKKTISRIESGSADLESLRPRTVEQIANALGVPAERLTQAPRSKLKEDLLLAGYRRMSVLLDGDAALAFEAVSYRYGIDPEAIVSLAPLLMTLLAEGSLAWRRDTLEEIEQHTSALETIARRGSFLAFAYPHRAEEGGYEEEESIQRRDLYGSHLGQAGQLTHDLYMGNTINPFSDYLAALASDLEPGVVEIDTDYGGPYRITPAEIDRITGEDTIAEFALRRGHTKIRAIPAELMPDDDDQKKEERIAWLRGKIPPDEVGIIATYLQHTLAEDASKEDQSDD